MNRHLWTIVALGLLACGARASSEDAGLAHDASALDASTLDASALDAAALDAGRASCLVPPARCPTLDEGAWVQVCSDHTGERYSMVPDAVQCRSDGLCRSEIALCPLTDERSMAICVDDEDCPELADPECEDCPDSSRVCSTALCEGGRCRQRRDLCPGTTCDDVGGAPDSEGARQCDLRSPSYECPNGAGGTGALLCHDASQTFCRTDVAPCSRRCDADSDCAALQNQRARCPVGEGTPELESVACLDGACVMTYRPCSGE